jgi:iron(III) transport system substrate-binding protein
MRPKAPSAILALLLAFTGLCRAQSDTLNLYSARHYQTDEALYADFTRATGIRISRIDADDAGILARLRTEGAASPADVILLVDAARLWRGEIDGLFQPVKSKVLEARIPSSLRGKDDGQGAHWYGFSTRARLVVYNKHRAKREDVDSYRKLSDPINKGKVCTRSGSHPYNLSLFGAMVEHLGPQKAESWLAGMVSNMARQPKGGDTDQILAVASGECGVALVNSYYVARLLRSTKPEDKAAMDKVGIVMPNQADFGTHLNIAGAGVARHSKNRDAAVKFLEYLAGESAQAYFADGNNEWPAVASVRVSNPALQVLGDFKRDTVPVSVIGLNQIKVQQMLDRVGYK